MSTVYLLVPIILSLALGATFTFVETRRSQQF